MATASWKVLCAKRGETNTSTLAVRHLQTECLVGNVVALAAVKHVLLDVVANGEELAARRISGGVLAVGASDALGERGCILVSDIRCNTTACTYR